VTTTLRSESMLEQTRKKSKKQTDKADGEKNAVDSRHTVPTSHSDAFYKAEDHGLSQRHERNAEYPEQDSRAELRVCLELLTMHRSIWHGKGDCRKQSGNGHAPS